MRVPKSGDRGSKRPLQTHLSDELKDRYGRRSVQVKKGDNVVVIKGDFKGVEGSVMRIDPKRGLIYVEGVTRESAEGKQVLVPLRAPNLVIKKLKLDDKFRKSRLSEKPVSEGSKGGE